MPEYSPIFERSIIEWASHNFPLFSFSYVISQYFKKAKAILILSSGIPFMDARYLMPHAQVIDICYTASMQSFISSCKKRFDHSIADEINYIYRLMKSKLLEAVNNDLIQVKNYGFNIIGREYMSKMEYGFVYLMVLFNVLMGA